MGWRGGNGRREAGASTPYKRWCKCTMENVRGKVFTAFFRNLGGKIR